MRLLDEVGFDVLLDDSRTGPEAAFAAVPAAAEFRHYADDDLRVIDMWSPPAAATDCSPANSGSHSGGAQVGGRAWTHDHERAPSSAAARRPLDRLAGLVRGRVGDAA